ncbi:hypothetical protein [Streptomyces sp. NPDC057052]|uniref:hypothetical protein n=1 Tax=Streptomyces sp. NPDC057052 TaxID=3346010 RepID=UPI003626FD22
MLLYVRATDFSALDRDGSALERLHRHLTGQIDRVRASGVEFGCLLGIFASAGVTAGACGRPWTPGPER